MASLLLSLIHLLTSALTTLTTWILTPSFTWTIVALVFLARRYSPDIYDLVIVHMTATWYRHVFELLPSGSRILDVGIGTGTALVHNADLVKKKHFSIVGVDYDAAYVEKCRINFKTHALTTASVIHKSVFDADLLSAVNRAAGGNYNEDDLFDCVYFSGSFSLMPMPHVALATTFKLLKPGGVIIVTQTFQKQNVPLLKFIKPALKFFTTIDFGNLTFVSEVEKIVDKSGLKLYEMKVIEGSVDNAFQAAYLLRVGGK